MTKDEAIWAASKMMQQLYANDNAGNTNILANILCAEADGNADYFCGALDQIIEFCEKLKKAMYNKED